MKYVLITNNQQLNDFYDKIKEEGPDFIAIDTEFCRVTTYWPILGLLQLATNNHAAIIDPVGNNLDLTPVLHIMDDPSIVKVFHAGSQDIEILFHLFNKFPSPVFDTQIAAAFAGLGEGLGYEKLVYKLIQVQIDKNEQFTDWTKRPLSKSKLEYAIGDVLHLREVYKIIKQTLEEKGRADWPQEHFQNMIDPDNFSAPLEDSWKKIGAALPRWRGYSILWDLSYWREQNARRFNIARNSMVENRFLMELAKVTTAATTAEAKDMYQVIDKQSFNAELNSCRQKVTGLGLLDDFYNCYESSVGLLNDNGEGLLLRKEEIKSWISRNFGKDIKEKERALITELQGKIKVTTEDLGIPAWCIASKKQIEGFVTGDLKSGKLLSTGWRSKILGDLPA